MSDIDFSKLRRVVIKIGSSLLTEELGIKEDFIHELGTQLRRVKENWPEVVLVSSGAVAAGLPLLGWTERPRNFTDIQAAAAVGQIHLYRCYHEILSGYGFQPAQYLLTSNDLADRLTFLNSRSTLQRLLELNLLPVVNENDALVIDSHHIGDNDHFAAELANLLEADLLVLLTDVEGIYSDFAKQELVHETSADDPALDGYINPDTGSRVGSGGMASKINAARRAATAGVHTIVASGHDLAKLAELSTVRSFGTLLYAPDAGMKAKARWLANSTIPAGHVVLDAGAVASVQQGKKSLLPIGITAVEGSFQRGDVIDLHSPDGTVVARGLSNYDAREIARLLKRHSNEIEGILGYVVAEEIVHRDNLVTLK